MLIKDFHKAFKPLHYFSHMSKNIGLVFVGEKVLSQGWPHKGFNSVEEAESLKNLIVSLSKRNGITLNYNYMGVISDEEELNNVKDKLLEMDGIIVAYLTTGKVYSLFREIVLLNKPTIIFAQPFSGHEWTLYSRIKDKSKAIIVASSDMNDLIRRIKLLEAILSLRNSCILLLTDRELDKGYIEKLEERFVKEIIHLTHRDLNKYYTETDVSEAERLAMKVIDKAVNVLEPSFDEIVKASRIYFALKNMLRDYRADAVTINCLSMIRHKAIPTTPCLAFSLLNDEGIPAACEADLNSLITMIILKHVTGKPSFISDPVPDFSKGYLYHAHCTSATRLFGIGKRQENYYLRNHAESLSGVAIQTLWPLGEKITSVKIEVNDDILLLHTGEIVENIDVDRGCRTKFAVKVGDVRKFVYDFKGGLHRIIVLGDYIEEMKEIGRLLGLNTIEEI